jgi:hypothetical protein
MSAAAGADDAAAPPGRSAGQHRPGRDRFADRGDGFLALIHPVGHTPQGAAETRDPGFRPAAGRAQRPPPAATPASGPVVVHAGTVFYDANGCFGETLDAAFRLLDAPSVKEVL